LIKKLFVILINSLGASSLSSLLSQNLRELIDEHDDKEINKKNTKIVFL
jgi:hypothetical protein